MGSVEQSVVYGMVSGPVTGGEHGWPFAGSSTPFPASKVRERYGDRTGFLERFQSAARKAATAGVIRPREVARLLDEAKAAWPE